MGCRCVIGCQVFLLRMSYVTVAFSSLGSRHTSPFPTVYLEGYDGRVPMPVPYNPDVD